MNLDKVMEDPWPALIDKLVSYLTREELDSIVDCLSDDILDRTRKKELRDRDIPKRVAIRKFIDTLSEDHGESGFMKLMLKVTETKQLTIRTDDGKSPPLHEYLAKCEKERKRYKEYCREKRILKSCDFVGRKEEMVEVKKMLFRENDKIAGTWISGMGGAGKTTLANQVCGMQGKYRMLYIDLNMLKGDSRTRYTIDDFYKRLTGPLDLPPLQQDQKICWETIYEELRKKRSAVVLYLDSLETLLSPKNTDEKLWEILREILSIQNSKVKLLITSVHSPEDCMPGQDSLKNMEHYPLKLFTLEDCHKLIRRVAPKIIRDPKQKSNIETVVSKLCGFNTLAVQTVFSFLKNYSDCITLDKFVASPKQQLKLAENNDRKTSQVITTLGRVFEGLNRATQEGLIKLSLSNGVQFDFTLAQSLLGEGDTTTLYSLVKAHLLQMEVKDKASTAEQKIDDENTRFFLHSLLQNLLESKCDTGNFQEVVENAESNIRAYIKNRLLELEEMESHDPKGKAGVIGSELQPLVLKYSSMPSIDNEHAQSYIKAARFQASLQHFLDRKNLKQFYADQLEFADGPRQTLKWVFLKLSEIEIMLKTGSSIERAGVDLAEVEKKLNEFGNNRQTTALKLSWAHFDLVNGQYLGLCLDLDNGIKSIQRALDVYEKEDGCSRQAARALHAIAIIHGKKPVDSYSTSECMKYEQRAFDRLGRSTIHFDQIVYSMSIGIKAHALGKLKQSVIENAKEGKKELSHKEVDEYKKDIKEYYEKASSYYKMSIDLCEKLKMKRSLEYIQLLRQKALLLAESEDIKKIEKAVRLAEESYQLIQEYDKTDMAHLAKCCIAIAHVHKRLGVKMYDSIKAKEGLYTDEQRYAPLWEAYYKFKRGFKFIKDGKLSADMHDYYGWQGSLRETMRWLNLDEKERNQICLEIERYIKNNMHEMKLYTRKTSVEERRSKDDRRRNISRAGKRHSIDTSQEDMVPPKRRNSSTDDTETMDLSSPVAGPSQSYYTHKRHSVSDDIPMMGLTLHTESMETCPEEKPTVFTKLKSSMRSTMGKLLPVLLIREPKKPDIRQDEKDPEDLSDSNSSVSDKDSALTGYSNSPSVISKTGSSDMELDTWVGQLPSRTSPRNYTYPHASISHDVRPAFGVPEIKVQDEGEQEGDSPDLSGKLPFDHYGITDSPCSNYKVKTWLGIKELKRPSSPGGSSDDSFYSTNMDVQD